MLSNITFFYSDSFSGIDGRKKLSVNLVEIITKSDLGKLTYRGKLRGKAVLATPPPKINLDRYSKVYS